MATMICKECLRELDETMFKMHRSGKRNCVCKDCISKKMKLSRLRWQDRGRARRLQDYSTRVMLEELASRGVVGKFYVDGNTFDLNNYNIYTSF